MQVEALEKRAEGLGHRAGNENIHRYRLEQDGAKGKVRIKGRQPRGLEATYSA